MKKIDFLRLPTKSQRRRAKKKRDQKVSRQHILLSVRQLAYYLGVGETWLYTSVERLQIPRIMHDGFWLFQLNEVDEWLRVHRVVEDYDNE